MDIPVVWTSAHGVTFSLNQLSKAVWMMWPISFCLNAFLRFTDIAGLAFIVKVTTGCISLSTWKELAFIRADVWPQPKWLSWRWMNESLWLPVKNCKHKCHNKSSFPWRKAQLSPFGVLSVRAAEAIQLSTVCSSAQSKTLARTHIKNVNQTYILLFRAITDVQRRYPPFLCISLTYLQKTFNLDYLH